MLKSLAVSRGIVALAACLPILLAQTPAGSEGTARKRALIISNTAYAKLPPPLVDDPGPKFSSVLHDAQFDVQTEHDLDFDSLIRVLDHFQASVQPGDICLFYYSGYVVQGLGKTYLAPISFDPDSNDEISNKAYVLARLQDGIPKNSPLLSMIVLDASWGTAKLAGQSGLTQQTVPPRTWLFASTQPNESTKEAPDHTGLFTSALLKAIPHPGLDLTALVSTVSREVETVSHGTQHPQSWESGAPRFYFHPPVPVGIAKQNKKDREMYVYIPAGKFWMGCAPAAEHECKPEEKPRHLVEITKGYWIGQNEVQNDSFQAFRKGRKDIKWKPYKSTTLAGRQGNVPVVKVTWAEAQKYCAWAGGRLPTEAEWERAYRDGKDDAVYPYSDSTRATEIANVQGKGGRDQWEDLAPVRQFDASPGYGLYDMAGNVWEWVSDWFNPTFYDRSGSESPSTDPENSDFPDKSKRRVVRGGSWYSSATTHLRLSYRKPGEPDNTVGFRCFLSDTDDVRKQLNFSQ